MTHARRVMDKLEIETVSKLYDEFKAAIDGTDGKVLPEDEAEKRNYTPLDPTKMKSAMKRAFSIKKGGGAEQLEAI